MSALYFEGFVVDEDSQHLASSVTGNYSVVTLPEIGITLGRGSPDRAVIEHAREAGRIVITGNGSDFVQEMRRAADRCNSYRCYEGGGMITVPSGLERLPFTRMTNQLTLNGERISWEDVFVCNLHVALHADLKVDVRSLPLCKYFLQRHAECPDCRRLGIVPKA